MSLYQCDTLYALQRYAFYFSQANHGNYSTCDVLPFSPLDLFIILIMEAAQKKSVRISEAVLLKGLVIHSFSGPENIILHLYSGFHIQCYLLVLHCIHCREKLWQCVFLCPLCVFGCFLVVFFYHVKHKFHHVFFFKACLRQC